MVHEDVFRQYNGKDISSDLGDSKKQLKARDLRNVFHLGLLGGSSG